jgi:hypothetical protein
MQKGAAKILTLVFMVMFFGRGGGDGPSDREYGCGRQ